MSSEAVWCKADDRKPAVAIVLAQLCALLCAGCANPGPPKPPSLHLPAMVTDLSAERVGDHVLLRWTTPAVTTDEFPVKGAVTAQVCRETGPRPGTPVARLNACAPILRLAVSRGPSQVLDVLSPALRSDPPVLLTYRVQILNAAGRSAGDSTAAALAASGAAPPPIEDLKATAGEHGAVLEWDATSGKKAVVELQRTDLSTPQLPAKPAPRSMSHVHTKNKPEAPKASGLKAIEEHPGEVRLRVPESANAANGASAGTVDADAKTGDTYSYVAQRVRLVTLGVHSLEVRSDPSSPVTLALRDIFPPARPTGLATISGSSPAPSLATGQVSYVDLSWEPNTEPDLAGYYVYRQQTNADGVAMDAMTKLTLSIIAAPVYRDVAVIPGQGYIYQVTAVDASGNESAPSAKAQELVMTVLHSPK